MGNSHSKPKPEIQDLPFPEIDKPLEPQSLKPGAADSEELEILAAMGASLGGERNVRLLSPEIASPTYLQRDRPAD